MKESANPALREFVEFFAPYTITGVKEHSEERKKKRAPLTRISQALDSQTNEKKRNTITGLMTSIGCWSW